MEDNKELKIEYVDIDRVKPYENNPRFNDNGVEATANSIEEFGWQKPIIVDESFVILAGHTRLKAARKLGLKQVPVQVAEGLTAEQKIAYRIADNKVAALSDWDVEKLADEIADISGLDLTDFGFTDLELADFEREVDPDDIPVRDEGEDSTATPPVSKRIIITYKTEEEREYLEQLFKIEGGLKDSYQLKDILARLGAEE